MKILIFLLTLSVFSCSGFPAYDYNLPITEEALNASIARINSQSWSRNLYGVVRSRVMGVDMWDSDVYGLDLQFSIRETVCTKASGKDPFTCDFKTGPFVCEDVFSKPECRICCSFLSRDIILKDNLPPELELPFRSVVEVSGELIANITVWCHRGTFSSESMSSEEMMHVPIRTPDRQGSSRREDEAFAPEAFPSRGRGSSHGNWNKPSYLNPNKME